MSTNFVRKETATNIVSVYVTSFPYT